MFGLLALLSFIVLVSGKINSNTRLNKQDANFTINPSKSMHDDRILNPDVVRRVSTLQFTIESYSADKLTPCMTDCINGQCLSGWTSKISCIKGTKRAATYFTAQSRYTTPECLSKCGYFGYSYSWCIISDNYKWDYCNPDTTRRMQDREFTQSNGPCKSACGYHDGTSYAWCYTYWSSWDYCDPDEKYYYEQVKNIYGKECRGLCDKHDESQHYWCIAENKDTYECAPTAVYFHSCAKCRISQKFRHRRQIRTQLPITETVEQYATRMENNNQFMTININNTTNPIYRYTHVPSTNANNPILPLVIRARIESRHIKPPKSRKKSKAVSKEAARNCRLMGMNTKRRDGNNDAIGHLIAYKNGGPPDAYNFAPQTQRINIGTTSGDHLISPSVWAASEITQTIWVQSRMGRSVEITIVVLYDGTQTRPIGFGTDETYFEPNNAIALQCLNYFYSNDPNEDPDCLNT